MITLHKGDLVEAFLNKEVDILAHGTNCVNGFGSGIAGVIAKRIPKVKTKFHEDYRIAKELEADQLGRVEHVYIHSANHIVANCYTQRSCGNAAASGHMYMSYDAMDSVLKKLANFASMNELVVGFPKIGCGLAGGDWDIVAHMIDTIFKKYGAEYKIYVL